VDGIRVDLSPREFALLECLLRHRGQVLSRDQLLDHAWPYDTEVVAGIVDTYVYFLRRKLGAAGGGRIETVRGVGYRVVA
jgi:DNA-binding response OmpR family regulator